MLKIDLSRQAGRFLRRLPPKQGRQLATKLSELRHEPNPQDSQHLKGYPYMRADAGEYRIIYRVEGDTLMVPLIGKRNDDEIYRILKRQR